MPRKVSGEQGQSGDRDAAGKSLGLIKPIYSELRNLRIQRRSTSGKTA